MGLNASIPSKALRAFVGEQRAPYLSRLSQVAAVICLAYGILPLIDLPQVTLRLQLPGFMFVLPLSASGMMGFLVALLATSGTDWVLQARGMRVSWRSRSAHWPLPAFVAWGLSVPLGSLPVSPQWWLVFGFGSALFMAVLAAEYAVSETGGTGHFWAYVTLTAVSFALFLVLAVTMRSLGARLYLAWLVMIPATVLVVLRNLYLRLGGYWAWEWALALALMVGQLTAGLHYLPMPPMAYGLVLTGAAYGLTSLAGALMEGRSWRTAWIEPVVMTALLWLLAVVFGRWNSGL